MTDCKTKKNPMRFIFGFLFLLAVTACQSQKTPAEVAIAFWSAVAKNDLKLAKQFCSSQSQSLLSSSLHDDLRNFSFDYGKIVIEGNLATVETLIISSTDKKSSFTTFLLKENNAWKVDFISSASDLESNQLFKNLFNNIRSLGENINKRFERQLPLIEKEIESLGQELDQQFDNLEEELKESFPQKKEDPYQGTI